MATTGYAVAVQDAIYAALIADTAFASYRGTTVGALDKRVYEVAAPPGTTLWTSTDPTLAAPRPYAIIGDGSETADVALCRTDGASYDARLRVRVWTPGPAERLAKVGAGHVRRLLHDQTLAMPDGGTCRVTAALERTQTDPDQQATQAIVALTLSITPP